MCELREPEKEVEKTNAFILLEHEQVLRTCAAANTSASMWKASNGPYTQSGCDAQRGCEVSTHGDI